MSLSAPRAFGDQAERIAAGGIPDSALLRLERLGEGRFSSFFSVADTALAADAGVVALGQVIGASACLMRIGVIRRTRGGMGRRALGAPGWYERDGPIRSWTIARQRATGRLVAQARSLGADAVVDVDVSRVEHSGSDASRVEVLMLGTAVRLPRQRQHDRDRMPFVCALGMPELWALRRAGVEVLGMAASVSSVFTRVGASTLRTLGRRRTSPNVELSDLTEGFYEARRLAVARLREDAERLGGSGVLDVDLAQSYSSGGRLPGSTVTVHLAGTVVRRPPKCPGLTATPVLEMDG